MTHPRDPHAANDHLPASEAEDQDEALEAERVPKPDADSALSGAIQQQGGAALGGLGERKSGEVFREDD